MCVYDILYFLFIKFLRNGSVAGMISHSLLNFPAISICVERFVRSEIGCKSADHFSSHIVSVIYNDKDLLQLGVVKF